MSDGGSPEIVCITNGQFAENCYLLADAAAGECAVVDPGEESGRILAEIARRGWRVTGVWLTHAHVDHVAGVGAVRAATGAAIHLHPGDRPLYDSLPQQAVWLGVRVEPAPGPDVELV
ncbi:MAG: MBL fold metallo-hydrolase, partial [Gemmatimonadota bacterium]|nr:MBL fold metallo-hydrolase [Gemmatimonadota bacterium]